MKPVFHLYGDIYIPTYILTISIAYCIGIIWVLARTKRKRLDINEAINLCFCIMFGGFLGARLLHIVYEEPSFYLSNPIQVLKFWQGGFVFYGGALGAFLASIYWIKKRDLDFYTWADNFTPVFAFGYALGRIGCFLNGCCYGKVCELPWAVHFETIGESMLIHRHPTQIYATLWELGVLALILHLEFWSKREKPLKFDLLTPTFKTFKTGKYFLLWMVLHGVGRLVMEGFRADPRGPELFLSISSWLSLIIVGCAVFAFYKMNKITSK